MANQYPNSGILFIQDPAKKTNPKSPDYEGNVELDAKMLADLVAMHNAQKPIKLDLAGWRKKSAKGNTFISLTAKLPFTKSEPVKEERPKSMFEIDDEIPF